MSMLLISDDPTLIDAVGSAIRPVDGLRLKVVPTISEVRDPEAWDGVALLLIHLTAPGPAPEVGGLVERMARGRNPVSTLVVADHPDPKRAVSLLRLGVADCLSWPLDMARLSYLIDALTVRARRSATIAAPAVERLPPTAGARPELDFDDGTGSTALLMGQVARVATQEATILLSGETGTGKSRLARLIHELSHRRAEPFRVVNCGALPPIQAESEMFGHVRGAFAGAEADRAGKFAEVGGGTLFLDEIDALPLTAQTRLLRAIEDRVYEPVGSMIRMPIRARLIAASSRPLEQEVAEQRFRSDLFYRLNVIGFHLAPLRERRDAIPTLASKFLAEFATRDGKAVAKLSMEALRTLERHDWPGNVRELRNLIERAVSVRSGDEIRPEDLPESVKRPAAWPRAVPGPASAIPSSAASRSTLAQIKRDAELARISEALEKHGNNRLRAAGELGISRMTLYKKLYKYGLMQPQAASGDGLA